MKTDFFEYYPPTEGEIKKAWKKGLFSFDANVLLSLYRYTEPSRKDLLSILTSMESRIWLPHQVVYEYFENRVSVIKEQTSKYQHLIAQIRKDLTWLTNELNSLKNKRHSTLPTEQIKKKAIKAYTSVIKEIEVAAKTHPDLLSFDAINDELDSLFAGKIGKAYNEKRYAEIFKEGRERYSKEIPPGYKDKDKEKKGLPENKIYGDLIVWRQILDKAKAENSTVVFVTNDLKEDWWDAYKGPRVELLREFYEFTGQKIYILNIDNFLERANKLEKSVKDKTIKEVADIMSDETIQVSFSNLKDQVSVNKWLKPTLTSDVLGDLQKAFSLPGLVDNITTMQNATKAFVASNEFKKAFEQFNSFQNATNKFQTFILTDEIAKRLGEIKAEQENKNTDIDLRESD